MNHELMRQKKKKIYFACYNIAERLLLHLFFLLMLMKGEIMPQDDFTVR
jgi:hypothetical protein